MLDVHFGSSPGNSRPRRHVEFRRSGRGHFGTVLGLRENDDAVGCDAPAGNLSQALRLETEGYPFFTPETLPGKRHGGWRCPAIIVQNRTSEEYVFFKRAVIVGRHFLHAKFETSADQRSLAYDQSSLGRFQRPSARTSAINSEVFRSRSGF